MRAHRRWPLAVAGLLLAPLCAEADDGVAIDGELRKWHRVTLTFDGPQTSEDATPNPFRDYRFRVTFTHFGSGKHYVVPGFFAADGNAAETSATAGDKWRVHFLPDQTGKWKYVASLRTGKNIAVSNDANDGKAAGFDGTSGELEIKPSNKAGRDHRAKGMLRYVGEHYLQFAEDDSWFLKGGADSPENFLAYADFDGTWSAKRGNRPRKGEALPKGLHRYEPHVRDWREGDPTWRDGKGKGIIGALNYLSSQGMNSVYFLTMNVGGDGQDVWPWTAPEARDRFDCSKLAQWEIVFSHMDARGILLHVILQEQENDQLHDGGALGDERKLYFRELIARFSHHPALVWNLGEENTNTDAQRKQFCNFLRSLDPYDHPIVCHTFPGKYDAVFEPLLGFEHFEGPSLQTNDTHRQTLRWVARSRAAGRKWVVNLDEIGPAHTGVKPDEDDPDHDEVRKKHLWGNLMAGGAGVEWYFGYRFAHNDLNCEDWRSRENMWKQTRIALDFFQQHLPFNQMIAADGLTDAGDDYVFTKPGAVYAVYLPRGGATTLQLPDAKYQVRWYNPRAGGDLQTGTLDMVEGPGAVGIGLPPDDRDQDWVARLTYAGDGAPPQVTLPKTALETASAGSGGDDITVKAENLVVTGFALVDADTDEPLEGFANVEGDVTVELSKLPTRNIDVVAHLKKRLAGSVRFAMDGKSNYQTENVAPYALEGDTNGDFNGRRLKPGTYRITATPFARSGARGPEGKSVTLTLSVVE